MGTKLWQPRAPRVLFSFFVLTVLLYVSDIHHSESIRAARESASEAQPQHRARLATHTRPNAALSAAPQSASDTTLAGAHLGLPQAQSAPSAAEHLSSNRRSTAALPVQADSGLPLASLVNDRALRQTLGRPTSQCGKSGNCRFRLIRGSLYRSRSCNPRRPNWQLLSGLLVSAVARAESAAGTPMPDVEVCMHQGASPLRGSEGPVLQWCSRSRDLLGFPSPYEADCVYKHRYVFTLEHYRRLSRDEHPRPSFAQRMPLAVWRGTCTGVASSWRADNLHNVPRAKLALLSRKHPDLLDAVLFPCGRCASLLRQRPSLFGNVSEALTDAQYANYKYVIDLDGDGCSGRLSKVFESGSVVLKPWQAGTPFFERAIRPWVHYVPLKNDLSDLLSTVRWLQTNEQEAAAIAANGAAFARDRLSSASIHGYIEALLRGAGRLHRAKPKADADDTIIYTANSTLSYVALNLTDHKERPLHVVCPAVDAPSWMLPVASASQLAEEYFSAAKHPRGPGRSRSGRKLG